MVTYTDRLKLHKPEESDINFPGHMDANADIMDGAAAPGNWDAIADPTINDDSDAGYVVGSFWWNVSAHRLFICENPALGAAVWRQVWPAFVPLSVSPELWRATVTDSSFDALIDTVSSTSVVYKTDHYEESLPDPTGYLQWGKVILHNVTRGNYRKITDVNLTTNTITTESSTDNWAANDIITIGSQTCIYTGGGRTYSRYFDVDISANIPPAARAVLLEIWNNEQSGTGSPSQNNFGCHPFEAYASGKATHQSATGSYQTAMSYILVPVISQKICVQAGAFGAVNASRMVALIRLRGYYL